MPSRSRTPRASTSTKTQGGSPLGIIREAADPTVTNAARGLLVRELADREHQGPGGERIRVGRSSLDRWIRAWQAGGFDALFPQARNAVPFTAAAVLGLAVTLKLEAPGRTAAQIAEIITVSKGWSPSARTIQREFAVNGHWFLPVDGRGFSPRMAWRIPRVWPWFSPGCSC